MIALLLFGGCATVGSLSQDLRNENTLTGNSMCVCEGFRQNIGVTQPDCLRIFNPSEAEAVCQETALKQDTAASKAHLACALDAFIGLNECLAAGDPCDRGTFQPCRSAQQDALDLCPQLPEPVLTAYEACTP